MYFIKPTLHVNTCMINITKHYLILFQLHLIGSNNVWISCIKSFIVWIIPCKLRRLNSDCAFSKVLDEWSGTFWLLFLRYDKTFYLECLIFAESMDIFIKFWRNLIAWSYRIVWFPLLDLVLMIYTYVIFTNRISWDILFGVYHKFMTLWAIILSTLVSPSLTERRTS